MKLGVFAVLFSDRPLPDVLDYIVETGCDAVEIGTGGYVGDAHCKPADLLADPDELKRFRHEIEDRELQISALSCHGNALHPDADLAARHDKVFRDTVRLAGELGVGQVVTFSGCPGDSATSQRPNWVTCPWPPDFTEILEWQWNERVGPYWQDMAGFLDEHGVRAAIELHPGFVVYNLDSFERLRTVAGDAVGVNLDPSHLFWQQIDPLTLIRRLGDAILHVHAKDTWIDHQNVATKGVLDTTPYRDEINRSWFFRTVGYGHDGVFWRSFISELRLAGYDGVLSIEHEDSLMSVDEGFSRAVAFLRDSIMTQSPGQPWWT